MARCLSPFFNDLLGENAMNSRIGAPRWLLLALASALAAAPIGCSQFDLRQAIPWGAGENGELEKPMKVVAIWTDAVRYEGEQVPTRGFGGRLWFYASEDGKPIKVKGSLVVYAFDDTLGDPSKVVPDRKYAFTPEQFARHYSKSTIGHSYSIWLPWDAAGGEQGKMTLVVRFQPQEGGTVVVSEPIEHVLPGRLPLDTPQFARRVGAADDEVRQAGLDVPLMPGERLAALQESARSRMSVATIAVPTSPGAATPTAVTRRRREAIALPAEEDFRANQTREEPLERLPAPRVRPRPDRFGPTRSRALGGPIPRLDRDHEPSEPLRAE
jgi:hypothetical protein